MAIRDRIRRVLRKSHSSGSDSSSHTDGSHGNSPTATPAVVTTSDVDKTTTPPSAFVRVFNNFSARSERDDSRRREPRLPRGRRRGRRSIHPSMRPLTIQNIQHQEMLSHFTMTFGATDPDQIESLSFCGISPCCTRTPSVDGDFAALRLAETTTDPEPDRTFD
ncbi:hypothetical protein XA68_13930 [Ophiocordyceps unilateralis]|uniref:Uncharacterized protein n=1 Tax=Ophiocordyceps unilateralis TaxID=268505 RepID=A0A2A9PB88_OPHUN|nr:hypothetical protein XA68_13930 [Ophiocordyceps unilateralis]